MTSLSVYDSPPCSLKYFQLCKRSKVDMVTFRGTSKTESEKQNKTHPKKSPLHVQCKMKTLYRDLQYLFSPYWILCSEAPFVYLGGPLVGRIGLQFFLPSVSNSIKVNAYKTSYTPGVLAWHVLVFKLWGWLCRFKILLWHKDQPCCQSLKEACHWSLGSLLALLSVIVTLKRSPTSKYS